MLTLLSEFSLIGTIHNEVNVLATNVNAINIIINVSLLLGAVAVIIKFFRPFYKGGKRVIEFWNRFQDDWEGTQARDGKERVPGVMEQLHGHDVSIKLIFKLLKEIKPDLFEDKEKV